MAKRWGKNGNSDRPFSWALKPLWMVDCHHEIKRCFFLEKSYNKPRQHIKKLRHHFVNKVRISSVAQSCLTLKPHGLKHARPPCPSPTPRVCSNSCLSSWWCHPPAHPLSSPFPPTFNHSQHQGLFQCVSSLHQVAKVLEFQLSICPSNEYSGLISFRMDLLNILAVQRTLKSLLQHHSSKASILWCSTLWSNSHIHTWLLEKS